MQGATVEFQWLTAQSDLNGKKGTVEVYLEDRGRYNVKVAETGEVIAVKPGNIKTVAPYTHHYLKKLQEDQEALRKLEESIKEGDWIMVRSDLLTDDKTPVQVPKGTRGNVARLDKDGDACIKFDGIPDRHWVYKNKFDKLAVRIKADKSPLKESAANVPRAGEDTQATAAKTKTRKNGTTGLRVDLS